MLVDWNQLVKEIKAFAEIQDAYQTYLALPVALSIQRVRVI